MAAVARRWKTQLNENSHSAAVAEELPEATHNTVVGYEQPDTLRDHQYVVLPGGGRRPAAQPRARADCRRSCWATLNIDHRRVDFEGHVRLAQAAAAISLGDYVSFYLALLYARGSDAVTESLDLIKASMAEFDPLADEPLAGMPRPDSGTDGGRRLM